MAKPDHPAAKAGRFVRAFGLTLQSELEKRNAATAAAQAAKPAPPPPPPPVPTADKMGKLIFGVFVAAVAVLGLVLLHAELVLPGPGKTIFRIAAASLSFVEGTLLLSNWQRANQRLVQRLLNRMWGPRAAVTRRERTFARIGRELLALLGIAFLAAGVFELLIAILGDGGSSI